MLKRHKLHRLVLGHFGVEVASRRWILRVSDCLSSQWMSIIVAIGEFREILAGTLCVFDIECMGKLFRVHVATVPACLYMIKGRNSQLYVWRMYMWHTTALRCAFDIESPVSFEKF